MSKRRTFQGPSDAGIAVETPEDTTEPAANGRKKPDRSNAPFAGVFASGHSGDLILVRAERTIGKARKYADMVKQMLTQTYGQDNWFVASIKRRDATYTPRTRKPKEQTPTS